MDRSSSATAEEQARQIEQALVQAELLAEEICTDQQQIAVFEKRRCAIAFC
jgi:hypothetical protein